MFKRLLVLSLVCMFSAHAMDKKITTQQIIQVLWETDILPADYPIEELSTHAIDKENEVLFTACAKHLSPDALARMNSHCLNRIPLRVLKSGNANRLGRILGTITQHLQNQSDEYK